MSATATLAKRAAPVPDAIDFAAYERETEVPKNIDFEQQVLGGVLLGAALPPNLKTADFFLDEHQLIFSAMESLAAIGAPIEVMSVLGQLKERGQATAAGGLKYLNGLQEGATNATSVWHYADAVAKAAKLRALAATGEQFKALARNAKDVPQAFADAHQALANITSLAGPPASAFQLLAPSDLLGLPPQQWRMHAVLPREGFAAIFGPSGSAKSFLVIHIIAAVAEGAECFGHRTKAGRVVYVVLEGKAGIPQRIQAWEKDTGRPFPEDVKFVFDSFKLTERAHVIGLAASIDASGGADVIVIDTLNRAAPSADENSSADMGAVLEAVKELQTMTGGLVVLVHHSGKDATKGMRGHSSVHAGLDAAIEVSRVGDRREWTVHKAKDGLDGEAHPFRLRVVELGRDEDGEPITSCVVDTGGSAQGQDAADHQTVRLPKGGNQRIVYDALGPLFRASHAFGRAGAPPTRPCLTLDEAINGTRDRLAVEPRRRGERARQAITGLIAAQVLGSNEGWLWLK